MIPTPQGERVEPRTAAPKPPCGHDLTHPSSCGPWFDYADACARAALSALREPLAEAICRNRPPEPMTELPFHADDECKAWARAAIDELLESKP